ncbi:hypothetical protein ACRAWD_16570 [Caulobacter segnis]
MKRPLAPRPDPRSRRWRPSMGPPKRRCCCAGASQKGFAVLPKSLNPVRLRQNLDLFGFAIDEADMALIATLDRGDGIAWPGVDPHQAGLIRRTTSSPEGGFVGEAGAAARSPFTIRHTLYWAVHRGGNARS